MLINIIPMHKGGNISTEMGPPHSLKEEGYSLADARMASKRSAMQFLKDHIL